MAAKLSSASRIAKPRKTLGNQQCSKCAYIRISQIGDADTLADIHGPLR
jgi:hypothetical protein